MHWGYVQTQTVMQMKEYGASLIGPHLYRYLFVGLVVFVLYFSLINLFVDQLAISYSIGITIAYSISVTCHFFLNKKFTFTKSGGAIRHQVLRYVAILFLNYGVTMCVVTLFVEHFHFSPYFAACVGIITTTAIGFFASKYWIFVERKSI
jgi:putative flippase GtrA